MHKALIAVVGPSGSGKSTSIRNLPVQTTRILDLERKGFPFKGFEKYTILPCGSPGEVDSNLTKCLADKDVTHIVVESFTKYVEQLLRLCQLTYKGYDVYTQYNKQIGAFLDKVKNDHAAVIMTAIDEIVTIPETDGSNSAQRRIAVKGKEWEGKVEKEFLMVLYTGARKTKDGGMQYVFQTNTDGVTSAKTPMDMFNTMYVPNDLNAVLEEAKKYYNNGTP
jgi:AAA domain